MALMTLSYHKQLMTLLCLPKFQQCVATLFNQNDKPRLARVEMCQYNDYHNFNQCRCKYYFDASFRNCRNQDLFARYMRSCKRGLMSSRLTQTSCHHLGCRYFSFYPDLYRRVKYQELKTISKAGFYISRHDSAVVEFVNFVSFCISPMIYLT